MKQPQEGPSPLRSVRVCIESNLANISLIGPLIQTLCRSIPLPDDVAFEIELCVVEAVVNVYKHAYREAPGKDITLGWFELAGAVEIEICDTGQAMPMELLTAELPVQDELETLEGLEESGRGVRLIRTLMEEVSQQSVDGRNTLRMIRRFPIEG